MSTWNDFNDAEQQQSFDLIPKGTVALVRMTIKPGGYDDPSQGWTGGYATQSYESAAIYLACEFVVLDGPFAKRKLWSNIGLHSGKGPAWANMGRSFIRAALNSANGVRSTDNSPKAAAARRIEGLHALVGLQFVVRIDIEKDGRGEMRNIVRSVVEPDHPEYQAYIPSSGAVVASASTSASAPAAYGTQAGASGTPAPIPTPSGHGGTGAGRAPAPVSGKPSWAQ